MSWCCDAAERALETRERVKSLSSRFYDELIVARMQPPEAKAEIEKEDNKRKTRKSETTTTKKKKSRHPRLTENDVLLPEPRDVNRSLISFRLWRRG